VRATSTEEEGVNRRARVPFRSVSPRLGSAIWSSQPLREIFYCQFCFFLRRTINYSLLFFERRPAWFIKQGLELVVRRVTTSRSTINNGIGSLQKAMKKSFFSIN
jgi:hypothetical protein